MAAPINMTFQINLGYETTSQCQSYIYVQGREEGQYIHFCNFFPMIYASWIFKARIGLVFVNDPGSYLKATSMGYFHFFVVISQVPLNLKSHLYPPTFFPETNWCAPIAHLAARNRTMVLMHLRLEHCGCKLHKSPLTE